MPRFVLLFSCVATVSQLLATVHAQNPLGRTPEERAAFLRRFDADGNGRLSETEWQKMRDAMSRRRPTSPETGTESNSTPYKNLYHVEPGPYAVETVNDLTLDDEDQDKKLPIRITYPRAGGQFPVIVFSHGMGGSKDSYTPLVRHWTSHGYVCIQPTHGDSLSLKTIDELAQIRGVAGFLNDPRALRHWRTRPLDIQRILDGLDEIERRAPAVKGKIDRKTIGMGGHSFGASTTQAVAGLAYKPLFGKRLSFDDSRPTAFIMISPQGTGRAQDADSFKPITRPSLFITGTKDKSPRNGKSYLWRREAFEHTPAGNKYLLVLEDAHHGFGGIAGEIRYAGSGPQRADHLQCVQSATLAFWDAHLKSDESAAGFLTPEAISKATDGKAILSRE
jgi:predicted dienelactone hydrolase